MGMLSVHIWGWGGGRRLGEVGIGDGIRERNVEFILLGAQLFILIFPVSCCIFLILGLNPDSTSFAVAELGKADIAGYSPVPALTPSISHCSKLLRRTRRNQDAPPPKKCQPHTSDPLCAHPRVTGTCECVI